MDDSLARKPPAPLGDKGMVLVPPVLDRAIARPLPNGWDTKKEANPNSPEKAGPPKDVCKSSPNSGAQRGFVRGSPKSSKSIWEKRCEA
jgi:hypothetical protein